MNRKLDTPVEVFEFDRMDAGDLAVILKKYVSPEKAGAGFRTALIFDKTPLAERDRIIKDLGAFTELVLFDNVEPNPKTVDIMEMFAGGENRTARKAGGTGAGFTDIDIVLGIGGGSVLDSAKGLAMLAANGGSLEEYLGASPTRTISKASIPLVLIPTTAGTGSEVTKVGVYTSPEGRKYTLGSPLMMAKAAVLSGAMLATVPPGLCAATGFDALDHALESIWNKNATDKTRVIAEEAAVEVLTWLPKAYAASLRVKNGAAPEAGFMEQSRNMLRASCMAGTAFNITGTAAGHALSFVLSEDWHVPHGTACAFTLLDIFDLALTDQKTAESLARISARFHGGVNDRSALVGLLRRQIADMKEEMKIPGRFADIGITLSKDEIDSRFSRAFSDPKMLNQMPPAAKENIYPILERKC